MFLMMEDHKGFPSLLVHLYLDPQIVFYREITRIPAALESTKVYIYMAPHDGIAGAVSSLLENIMYPLMKPHCRLGVSLNLRGGRNEDDLNW